MHSIQQDNFNRLQLPRRAVALVLAGGRGSRLQDLTARRAKPAVYFGGKFRIIDFALSNCINSGIRRIGVIPQYKSPSLLRYLQKGWSFQRWEANEFIELLPAQQRIDDEAWYRGTADAVYQNIDIVRDHQSVYIVVLAGDHSCKMDYARRLQFHVDHGALCTVGCIEVARTAASGFGVMAVDRSDQAREFVENPHEPPAMLGNPDRALASMGIHVFNTGFLFEELERDIRDPNSSHDFGKDIIPAMVRRGVVCAHPFAQSCVSTEGAAPNEPLPPAKFVFDNDERRALAVDSIVSGGCIIAGARVARSVLFSKVRIHSYCNIDGVILLPGV